MADVQVVSMDEYSRTSYRPDVEYLDGVLKPKPENGIEHGRTEALLGVWFYEHRKEWRVHCALNARTQVSSVCVRLVDVVVVDSWNREKEELRIPPLVAIEVLSAADTYVDLKARFHDLELMGVPNIRLVDPETRTGEVWRQSSWSVAEGGMFEAVDSPVSLNLDWVWKQLDE